MCIPSIDVTQSDRQPFNIIILHIKSLTCSANHAVDHKCGLTAAVCLLVISRSHAVAGDKQCVAYCFNVPPALLIFIFVPQALPHAQSQSFTIMASSLLLLNHHCDEIASAFISQCLLSILTWTYWLWAFPSTHSLSSYSLTAGKIERKKGQRKSKFFCLRSPSPSSSCTFFLLWLPWTKPLYEMRTE